MMALVRSLEGLGEGAEERQTKEWEPNAEVSISWIGAGGRTPVLLFSAAVIQNFEESPTQPLPSPYRLTFKLAIDVKVLRTLLFAHGFSEVSSTSSHFNLMWTLSHVKPHTLKQLLPHQKVNHFPRSYELTKKNKLSQNVQRMQCLKGLKHFNIIPKTFTIPEDLRQFHATFRKHRGTWIVKPTALSRGRGISLINDPSQVTRSEPVVVSQYIGNPLCVDGFKFDLRLYVAVTSFHPLRIYLYEEGLTRFTTVRYAGGGVELDNLCMHLTNFSINKMSQDYVRCDDPELEDYGSKWSMSALFRYLQDQGFNVAELIMRIEDVVVKTILCAESSISDACRIFQNHRGNCFELYGFDILIDENLKPWVLEVNLSPSLTCGAPLDLRLKSNLVADLLSLAGIVIRDPYTGEVGLPQQPSKPGSRTRKRTGPFQGLSVEEVAVVRETKQEYDRRGGFVRIFPTEDSWELYGAFLNNSKSPLNHTLHCQLYPDSVKVAHPVAPCSLAAVISKRLLSKSSSDTMPSGNSPAGLTVLERVVIYLRKLKNRNQFPQSLVPEPSPTDPLSQLKKVPSDPPQAPETKTVTTPAPPDQSIFSAKENIAHLLKNAGQLSKLQARAVFASYLECVQERLLRETSVFTPEDDTSSDQMNIDLVVRFLKKAAMNLKKSFTIVVPNHRLPLRDRRRILAKQLSEFVTLYRKETAQLQHGGNTADNSPAIHSDMFSKALLQASEDNLELLLATYAKQSQNKSSAVFLGNTCKDDHLAGDESRQKTAAASESVQPAMKDARLPAGRDSLTDKHRTDDISRMSRGTSYFLTSSSKESKAPSTTNAPLSKCSWADGISSSLVYSTPSYSDHLLRSSSLPPSHQESLMKLTASLAGWNCKSQEPTSGKTTRVKTQSLETHPAGRLHQRSLSLQSLASTASDTSQTYDHSRKLSLKSTARFNANSVVKRRANSVVMSKNKPYISPYAHPARIKSTAWPSQPKKSQTANTPYPLPHPAASEESVVSALQRLTQRQNSRKYSQPTIKRPIIAQAWVEPSRNMKQKPVQADSGKTETSSCAFKHTSRPLLALPPSRKTIFQ